MSFLPSLIFPPALTDCSSLGGLDLGNDVLREPTIGQEPGLTTDLVQILEHNQGLTSKEAQKDQLLGSPRR